MIPLVPSLIGLAAAVVLSFASGYKIRGDAEKAKQLEVERGWHEKYKRGVAEAQMAAETVGSQLRGEVASRTHELARLRADLGAARSTGKVRLATCAPVSTRPVLAAAPTDASTAAGGDDSRVSLTDDFRLRYSGSLSLVVPSGDRAQWVATAAALTDPVGLWDVLENVTENSGRWAQCREQMMAAQSWFRQMGWVR